MSFMKLKTTAICLFAFVTHSKHLHSNANVTNNIFNINSSKSIFLLINIFDFSYENYGNIVFSKEIFLLAFDQGNDTAPLAKYHLVLMSFYPIFLPKPVQTEFLFISKY